MIQQLIDFIIGLPQYFASFSTWLTSPINSTYLNISPLALFSIGGASILIVVIAVHVVRLFV